MKKDRGGRSKMAGGRLSRTDMPGLHRVASATSSVGQQALNRLMALVLLSGIGSAALSVTSGKAGSAWFIFASGTSALLFFVAAAGAAWLGGGEAQRRWHDGRAAAESIKTLSWKYTMCSAPFEEDATADDRFLERMRDILAALAHLRLAEAPDVGRAGAISPAMRELRAAPIEIKREVYCTDRIGDQIRWYGSKAAAAERRAAQWRSVTLVIGAAGLAGAVAYSAGKTGVNLLGGASAALASISAWTQLRQYWPNSAAYRLALNELDIIATEAHRLGNDENAWAAFCERAETAISREHTMWRARAR